RENNIGFVDQAFDTYDLDFRHHFPLGSWHNIIWGVGYRSVHDRLESLTTPPGTVLAFDPVERTYDTFSTFAQDEMALTESFFLTVGAKLQHHEFTGWEVQPTIRVLYSPEESWAAWAAVSRAVRTPSRIEHDGVIAAGVVPFLDFVPTFESEELIAYEVGYRSQPEPWFSWDVALFFNQYDDLSSLRATPPGVLPIINSNDNTGEGYGAELAAQLDITDDWRLTGNYSFLQLQIHPGPGTLDFLGAAGASIEGSSPHNQVFLMSSHDLTDHIQLDVISRYIDKLPFQNVAGYIALDVRLAWRPNSCTEVAVVGQNLLDSHHPEFSGGNEIKRGVYGMFTLSW
ncbi:MAG: TonB-dependent receptor, partial [Pirellulales bacterium]